MKIVILMYGNSLIFNFLDYICLMFFFVGEYMLEYF